MDVKGTFRHLKTGKFYVVLGKVINATNSANLELMIRYADIDNPSVEFVREEQEFLEKFKRFL